MLRAAVEVRRQIPQVRFQILGAVSDPAYFDRCAAFVAHHDLQATVEFGEAGDSAEAYRRADVMCLPSVTEAMPYSVLEAMFSLCPVVASDVGGIAEILAGAGVLVRPGDASGLAQALTFLLSAGAEHRAQLAAKALERARQNYTLQQLASRFEEIYCNLTYEQPREQLAQAAS